MNLKSVYTAHTFVYRAFIRDKLCPFLQSLGILTENPFYNPDGSVREGRPEVVIADQMDAGIDARDNISWMKLVKKKSDDIVTNDLGLIDGVEGVVAYMIEWSGGTTCEIFYAGYVQKKPVFLITSNASIYRHPWMVEACKYGKIFKSYQAFKKYMCEQYGNKTT
jgi:hypothetical protein